MPRKRPPAPVAPAPVWDPTLSKKAAAEYLGESTTAIDRYRRDGVLSSEPRGRGKKRPHVGIKLSVLNAFRAERARILAEAKALGQSERDARDAG